MRSAVSDLEDGDLQPAEGVLFADADIDLERTEEVGEGEVVYTLHLDWTAGDDEFEFRVREVGDQDLKATVALEGANESLYSVFMEALRAYRDDGLRSNYSWDSDLQRSYRLDF